MQKKILLVIMLLVGIVFMSMAVSGYTSEAEGPISLSQDGEGAVVLELFTSQGCSSCPPADALLEKIDQEGNSNIVALSYHVDYWNYIGWEDPFSSARYSMRQSKYNRKFGSRSNYTPQIVVNGQEHFVGSDAAKLRQSIKNYSKLVSENSIEIETISKNDGEIKLNYRIEGPIVEKDLRAVLLIDKRSTEVSRGENRNRNLTNSNIVISELEKELKNSSGDLTFTIPTIVDREDDLRVAILIENAVSDITGAAKSKIVNK